MLAQLIPLDGDDPIILEKDITVVGRKKELCDLWIDDKSVSKLQTMLIKTDGLLFIRDLCSTNGTRVNGQKVTRGALLPGDELSFGKVRFRVFLGPSDDSRPRPTEKTEMMTSFQLPPVTSESDADRARAEKLIQDSMSEIQLGPTDSNG